LSIAVSIESIIGANPHIPICSLEKRSNHIMAQPAVGCSDLMVRRSPIFKDKNTFGSPHPNITRSILKQSPHHTRLSGIQPFVLKGLDIHDIPAIPSAYPNTVTIQQHGTHVVG